MLAGKTADGSTPLNLNIPFSKKPETRAAAANLLGNVLNDVSSAIPPDALTPLTAKLLSHLSRTGLQSREAITAFPASTLADAIREAPDVLSSKASVAAILRGHDRRNQQAAASLKRTLSPDIPPRHILWQNEHGYSLEEATDPRHLQQDSAALKHCVGTSHNSDTLARAGLSRTDPEALHHLHYWQKIKKGETRIFTLMQSNQPVATLDYETETKSIVQISGYQNQSVSAASPHFSSLCGALHATNSTLQTRTIADLPNIPPNTILTAEGNFVRPTATNIALAIAGNVTLNATSTEEITQAALSSDKLNADITLLRKKVIDTLTHIKCSIHSDANSFSAPTLQTSRDVDLPAATTVEMPALQSSGSINLPAATTVKMSALQTSGSIYLPSATTVEMPALQTSETIDLRAATIVELPALQTSENINLPAATTVKMPSLKTSGYIDLPIATTVEILVLQTNGDIYLTTATTVETHNLQTSAGIFAPKANFKTTDAIER